MKTESRTKKSVKNIIGGIIFRIIGVVFPFAIKTIIIWTLGAKYLGLNNLFSSVLSVLSLSELGIGSALVFNMYKPLAEGNDEMVCALLKAYRRFYRIIGIVILLLGICLMPALKFLIKGEYPVEINIYVLFAIHLLDTVISYFLFAYKGALLEANQNNGVENILHSITNIVMYVVQIVVLLVTHNYYLYLSLMPICTILLNLIRSKLVDRLYPKYKCCGNLDSSLIKDIFNKVKSLIGHKIGSTIITSADNIVISSFLGLEVLAIYGNYYIIISSLIAFVTIFYTSITASVGNSLVTDSKLQIYKTFSMLNFLNNWIVGWCSVCLVCLYQPFMKWWMGEKMMLPFHMVVLFSVYFYVWLARRIGLTYKDAAGMWEQDFWKPYIGIVVNLVINIALVKIIGIEGVVISTIIVMTLIYFPWETYVLFEYIFNCSSKEYILKMLGYIVVTLVSGVVTFLLCSLVELEGILEIIVRCLICVIVPNIIFIITYCKTSEFLQLKNKVLNILKQL